MDISTLLSKANIREYCEQYTELKEVKGEWWGISPLNSKDTNPSFSVRESDGVFYDFSAGCGGNVLDFIQRHDHCNFKTAVKKLRAWLGVEDEITLTPINVIKELRSYRQLNQKKKDSARSTICESALEQFRCSDFHFWDDEGLTADIVRQYDVGYDRRGQCITIPVRNNRGELINILCRTTNEHAQELGIPKYIYRYKLGALDFFWGWWNNSASIHSKREVILVEGAKSVMKLSGFGYDNAVAVLTSHITDDQMRWLVREGMDVVVALDKDIDPTKDENLRRLRRYCKVYLAVDRHRRLGEKDSPCDRGRAVWDQIYNERKLWR